jgi:hypothetical protein
MKKQTSTIYGGFTPSEYKAMFDLCVIAIIAYVITHIDVVASKVSIVLNF